MTLSATAALVSFWAYACLIPWLSRSALTTFNRNSCLLSVRIRLGRLSPLKMSRKALATDAPFLSFKGRIRRYFVYDHEDVGIAFVVLAEFHHIHEIGRPLVVDSCHEYPVSSKIPPERSLETIRLLSLQPLSYLILANDVFSGFSHISIQIVGPIETPSIRRVVINVFQVILPRRHVSSVVV